MGKGHDDCGEVSGDKSSENGRDGRSNIGTQRIRENLRQGEHSSTGHWYDQGRRYGATLNNDSKQGTDEKSPQSSAKEVSIKPQLCLLDNQSPQGINHFFQGEKKQNQRENYEKPRMKSKEAFHQDDWRVGQCLERAQESEPTDALKRVTKKSGGDSQEIGRQLKRKQDQDSKPIEEIVHNSRGKGPTELMTSTNFREGG
jgi:hypothetical protein